MLCTVYYGQSDVIAETSIFAVNYPHPKITELWLLYLCYWSTCEKNDLPRYERNSCNVTTWNKFDFAFLLDWFDQPDTIAPIH